MAISAANLKWYLSGGAGNTDPNLSLGGARSTTQLSGSLNNLFDDVSGDESVAGDIEYRCLYFRNEDANANGLMSPCTVWISQQTTASGDDISIGLDPAGKNGTATTATTESTAPAGVSFTTPLSKGAGLALPSLPFAQNDYVAIWVRRTVSAGAAADSNDQATLAVEGDTV